MGSCPCCKEAPEGPKGQKWYFRISVLIIAFLCIGPFALPLVWLNPRFSAKAKFVITILALCVSYIFGIAMRNSMKNIMEYYQLMSK